MMKYKYLANRGALNETPQRSVSGGNRSLIPATIPRRVLELVPSSVAREHFVLPLSFDGETITCAAKNAEDIGLTDKLRFLLNRNIRLVQVPEDALREAIELHFETTDNDSVESMLQEFTDTAMSFEAAPAAEPGRRPQVSGTVPPTRAARGRVAALQAVPSNLIQAVKPRRRTAGLDGTTEIGRAGMFYRVVEEGQRVLMRRSNGTMEVIIGPRRIWRGRSTFAQMEHFIAHPGEYLMLRYRDGRQQHLPGPADLWLDPRIHEEISREDALQLAAKEAVVVYRKREGADTITRRIEYGPALFIPQPGEWLHTFSWHSSVGGHKGVHKVPNALVFQKLWLLPDQMYHDVTDVRTADDAMLTVRLMIFFELVDIERMLDTTHDPIGDFVNAATSDVVEFTGRHDFESFKRMTDKLNELETYRQLAVRATQCGYRINKVVYRGYGAPESLQQMHDKAIEARTRLQLERATEQQAQDLENYKLDCQIARAGKRRGEQATEVGHDLEIAGQRQQAELRQREAHLTSQREQRRLETEQQQSLRQRQDAQQREHLGALRDMGVDLTAFLTQARADRVIEVRGNSAGAHLHLDQGKDTGEDGKT